MFSPALISAMLHRLDWGNEKGVERKMRFPSQQDFAGEFHGLIRQRGLADWPRLPIVGRATFPISYTHWFDGSVSVDDDSPTAFFWGRVPIDRLAEFFQEFRSTPAGRLYVDLGTPLRTAGSGSSFDQDCATYLAASAQGQPKVGVAIVDLGDEAKGSVPDDYKGKLHHAVTTDIKLSEHAEKVLSALLLRLDSRRPKVLPDTKVSCALVRKPAAMVSANKGPLDQVNATEMLDAVKALNGLLAADKVPTVVNMSLGTHVGPHNGASPLEEYLSSRVFQANERFLVVSAGNDGGKGVAAKRVLAKDDREFLRLRTGARCQELLVEFWWDDAQQGTMEVEASIEQPLSTGGRKHLGTVTITPGTAGVLSTAPAGLPSGMLTQSLFSAKCLNNLTCIAFALSSTAAQPLPELDIRFSLESSLGVIVNAWIVVAEPDPQTAFLEGGQEGTIMVPASDGSVVSVAGTEAGGQVWQGSSRGPAAQYVVGTTGVTSPLLAHLVAHKGDSGTSFSSPRACADMAAVLVDSKRRANCSDALDLVCETYGLKRSSLPTWSPRIGYHKEK